MIMEEGKTEFGLFREAPAFCDTLLLATYSPLPYYTGPRASSYSINLAACLFTNTMHFFMTIAP